ncbi:MAG: response regulator transcription factor [Gemmatimonadales bacterium]
MTQQPKRIVVVGDARIYREALVAILARKDGFDVAGEFAVVATTVDAVAELAPVLVVIDGRSRAGPELARQLIARLPRLEVIAAGVPEEAETLVPWARAGVHGFVLDGEGTAGLEAVIHAVGREGFSCPRRITGQLLRRLGNARAVRSPADVLTSREREVAALLDQGLNGDCPCGWGSVSPPSRITSTTFLRSSAQQRERGGGAGPADVRSALVLIGVRGPESAPKQRGEARRQQRRRQILSEGDTSQPIEPRSEANRATAVSARPARTATDSSPFPERRA